MLKIYVWIFSIILWHKYVVNLDKLECRVFHLDVITRAVRTSYFFFSSVLYTGVCGGICFPLWNTQKLSPEKCRDSLDSGWNFNFWATIHLILREFVAMSLHLLVKRQYTVILLCLCASNTSIQTQENRHKQFVSVTCSYSKISSAQVVKSDPLFTTTGWTVKQTDRQVADELQTLCLQLTLSISSTKA